MRELKWDIIEKLWSNRRDVLKLVLHIRGRYRTTSRSIADSIRLAKLAYTQFSRYFEVIRNCKRRELVMKT